MTKEEKIKVIQELKQYWKLEEWYFYPKCKIEIKGKVYIPLFESEVKKGGVFYTEIVDFSFKPNQKRELLKIDFTNRSIVEFESYETKIGHQLLIPIEEFAKVNYEIVYEDAHVESLSARDWACIHLQIPKSNKNWLNELIKEKNG